MTWKILCMRTSFENLFDSDFVLVSRDQETKPTKIFKVGSAAARRPAVTQAVAPPVSCFGGCDKTAPIIRTSCEDNIVSIHICLLRFETRSLWTISIYIPPLCQLAIIGSQLRTALSLDQRKRKREPFEKSRVFQKKERKNTGRVYSVLTATIFRSPTSSTSLRIEWVKRCKKCLTKWRFSGKRKSQTVDFILERIPLSAWTYVEQ